MIRLFLLLILGAIPVAQISLAGAAWAISPQEEQNRARCGDSNPDIGIAGCTAVIQSGEETNENLAIAFNNRGIAYRDKGQYDRAIQDLDQAIKLEPDYALALP